jgi:hypothetical protein
MSHVVLLGDSVFDNGAYTSGEPDVISHLRRLLPDRWQATLLARDGATIADLPAQLRRLPSSASHLVVSIGGNDVLRHIDLLSLAASSGQEVLERFTSRVAPFENGYRTAIAEVLTLGRQTTVCTIYNGCFDAARAAALRTGLAIFNDVILRTVTDLNVDGLELRSICTEASDYANPIEPSGRGGAKLARAIACVAGIQPSAPPARVWNGTCSRT